LTGQEAATNVASGAMRRLFAWLAGAAGGLAAYRALRRRPPQLESPNTRADTGADTGADARAEELRARLAEARTAGEGGTEPETGDSLDEAPPADPDARRRAVHEQARGAIDEMQSD
jgi:hypothetical protein